MRCDRAGNPCGLAVPLTTQPPTIDPTILAGEYPGVLLLLDIGSGLWSIIKFSAQLRLSISPVKSLFLTHPLKQGITNITRAVAVVCCVLPAH